MTIDPQALGRAVRDLREGAGKTQEELGKAAGYQTGAAVSISRLETGKAQPGIDRMKMIAEVLGVELEELQQRASNPNREAQRRNERPKDREQRVISEVAERKERLDEATAAFTEAYEKATESFLLKFGRIVEQIKGAPPLETPASPQQHSEDTMAAAIADESIELGATAAGGAAAGVVLGLLSTGKFSRSVAGLGVAGIGAAAIGVLAESAVALIMSTRKQQRERMRKLDEIEEQLEATEEGAGALITRLPRATELLNYIAVHAGHALDRWERGLGGSTSNWESLGVEAVDRFREFILIAQTAFAIRIEFEALSSGQQGDDLRRKIGDVDALLTIANEVVTSRV
ncbi:MAG TPA: helix-turn-helix transcriptional regulator [Microbacteriaceae bacterium]|jgi:transcriptional regulator with XRE-family HTH domain|nr:helix-turn-helix transcriptional regulator [Microbacteriaceae bacterium]